MRVLAGTTDGVVDLQTAHRFLSGRRIKHVAWEDDSWWAVDDSGGIWRDGQQVAVGQHVGFNCILPLAHGVWLGADRARLYHLGDDGLQEDAAFASAPGRARWSTPWGGPPDVRSLTFGPDGVLYVNVHVGGILVYDDSGLTPTIDIAADVHQVVAHPERPGTVLAATAWGLAVATDGHDFSFRTEGLAHTYCRALAVRGDDVLVSAARGPGGGDAGVYRGQVGGGTLIRCHRGLPESFQGNVDTHCLAADPDGFWVVNGERAWFSTDAESWTGVEVDMPAVTGVAVGSTALR